MTARRRCDPFELLCRQAAGRSIPEPPAIPGRSFVQRMGADKADPYAEAWDRENEPSRTALPLPQQPHQPGAPAPGLAPGMPATAADPQACPVSSTLATT